MYFALIIRRLHRSMNLFHRIRFNRNSIGFNRNRDVALVKVKVDCGVLCGSVQLYQLHKIDGRWQQAKVVGCGLVF